MSKRDNYPDHRRYQSKQMKMLLSTMSTILDDEIVLEKRDPIREGTLRRLLTLKEMLDEISLRLD